MTVFSLDAIADLILGEYGLAGELSRLPGEHANYQLVATGAQSFVVKLADDGVRSGELEFERSLVDHLRGSGLDLAFPRVVPTKTGAFEAVGTGGGAGGLRVRLFEYVPGTAWCEAGAVPPGRFRNLGAALGAIDAALATFTHPASARTHPWDLAAAGQHRAKTRFVEDESRRRLLEYGFHLHASVLPRLIGLPRSVVHGDANDENVLVDGERVTGFVDFGDSLENPTVSELAIALAYAMLDVADPLDAGAAVVGGYHSTRPLGADECEVLFPLVCGRLSVTVAMAAERRTIDPHNPTWFVTEDRAWRLLQQLVAIAPADAAARLASETGVESSGDRGAPVSALLEQRRRLISPALSLAYREPIKMTRGLGQYLWDVRGRPFLDLVNNVCHVGHCHPRVVEAGQRQMARLNTNTRYLYDGLTDYAERLTATLPQSLEVCLFVNSGTEANELALRIAAAHTGRRDVVVGDGAYHGHTAALIEASPYKFNGPGGSGEPASWVHVVPVADGYRGTHRGGDAATGEAYADEVKRVLDGSPRPMAAFLIESFQSCGGQVIPPPGYLAAAFRHVRAAGGLCIVDEVQVGFGRTGAHFWAFESQGVVPDMVVLGKPMGNGHPMGAVVTTREVADGFANGMEFFSSFGGNPVSCAIGLAVLDVIRDEQLQAHALDVGTRLANGLRELGTRHALIGDVRGAGLFIGVELVRDRETLEPATDEADDLVNRLQRRSLLLGTDGPHRNVIKIKPPLVITAEDVDTVVRAFDDELGRMEETQG
jgi:4-aminobutyrate aminotransferase-like enzyme